MLLGISTQSHICNVCGLATLPLWQPGYKPCEITPGTVHSIQQCVHRLWKWHPHDPVRKSDIVMVLNLGAILPLLAGGNRPGLTRAVSACGGRQQGCVGPWLSAPWASISEDELRLSCPLIPAAPLTDSTVCHSCPDHIVPWVKEEAGTLVLNNMMLIGYASWSWPFCILIPNQHLFLLQAANK